MAYCDVMLNRSRYAGALLGGAASRGAVRPGCLLQSKQALADFVSPEDEASEVIGPGRLGLVQTIDSRYSPRDFRTVSMREWKPAAGFLVSCDALRR